MSEALDSELDNVIDLPEICSAPAGEIIIIGKIITKITTIKYFIDDIIFLLINYFHY